MISRTDRALAVDAGTATPVRGLGVADPSGLVLLRDTALDYRDGAEAAVLAIVEAAADRSSYSDEMIVRASGWAQRYHLDPTRANIVRCLDLPPAARVLEIGAGCGAITRYLGESCALVDALEPVPVRAAAAAARTRDLPGVRVFVGELDDVPEQPVYDVVVVVGVLEYIGAGAAEPAPYLRFLRAINARLADGGTLVLAIENRLGVKYLVGSPEDHTNRVFDSIESYPVGGKARTFARAELEGMLRASGLTPATRVAFPDYKMTRAVLGELPPVARSLAYRVPRFPSPDWLAQRPQLADEASVWRNLVEAGVATDFGNSFLVLAGRDGPGELWPAGRCAAFYSEDRLASLTTQTLVEADGDSVRFRRTRVAPGCEADDGARVLESVNPYQPGRDLPAVVAEVGVAGARPLLTEWLRLLDAAVAASDPTAIDLVPHNLVVADDGSVRVIDEELMVDPVERDHVVRRGVYHLAKQAVLLAPPARWAPCTTVGEVMVALGELVGLPADGSWLDQLIGEESRMQVGIRRGPTADCATPEQWLAKIELGMRDSIARRLADLPLGERLPARIARVGADNKKLRAERDALRAERDQARADLARVRRKADRSAARVLADQVLPRGTRRRALVEHLRPAR